MVKLKIQVTEARERTALVTLTAMGSHVATGHAVATASAEIAAAHGNPQCDPLRAWGHPPTGKYDFIQRLSQKYQYSGEYGWHILLFEPVEGAALAAQATGRNGLLVYGGPRGDDNLMRRTQGGVRLDAALLGLLTDRFWYEQYITLIIETQRKPSWWQFWKSMPDTPALSATAPRDCAAPLDEASIIREMMKSSRRHGYAGSGAESRYEPKPEQERERDDHRHDDRSSSNRSSSTDMLQDSGGQSGGAGASGGWDGTPANVRSADTAGHIAAGVAAGAALGVLIHETSTARTDSESSSASDTSYSASTSDTSYSDSSSDSSSSGSSSDTSSSGSSD